MLARILEQRTGQQLAASRRWRIETALAAVMRDRGFASLDQLLGAVAAGRDQTLTDAVIDALLNNETFFYRDRAAFDQLLKGAFPTLQTTRARERRLSIWCAGCSTGQEAYSLAMSFADDRARWAGWKVDIVGTDISRSAIGRAREGIYSQFEVQRGLSVLQMMRWFTDEEGQQWRISPQIRDMVRFETRSLADDPPAGTFDIILCRNVLMYFSPAMRSTVLGKLSEAIAPDGYLMLGAGETVIGHGDAFVPAPDHRGLYRRNPDAGEAPPLRSFG